MAAEKIKLLVPLDGAHSVEFEDREGGETHSVKTAVRDFCLGAQELDVDLLAANLEGCLNKLQSVFRGLRNKAVENWEVDAVTVSLGISGEGSIGVVTAGLEGSIEVSFKRTANDNSTTHSR